MEEEPDSGSCGASAQWSWVDTAWGGKVDFTFLFRPSHIISAVFVVILLVLFFMFFL